MTLNNWFLVAMGVFFVIPIIYKQYFLVMAFVLFGLCFGFLEFVSHYATDHTISMQIWDLIKEHSYKGIFVLVCMLLAWLCLLAHLSGIGRK
jgi:hypothetical protein